MKPQKTLNCQSNFEKKGQSWWYHTTLFQTILQSYINQNSMVLAQKQIKWNRIESSEISLHIHAQLIYNNRGKNIRKRCHSFFQGIFWIQGLNPCLLHCRWIFFFFNHLSHQGSPVFRRGRAKFQTVSRKTMVKNRLVWWENKPDKN